MSHFGNCWRCGEPASAARASYRAPICASKSCTEWAIGAGYAPVDGDGMIRANVVGVDEEGKSEGAGDWNWNPPQRLAPDEAQPGSAPIEGGMVWGQRPPPVHVRGARSGNGVNAKPTPLAVLEERRLSDDLRLSDRERQVKHLAAMGYSYPEIGDMLGIGKASARCYLRRAKAKAADVPESEDA